MFIMATEADTSGSESLITSNSPHHHRSNHHHQQHHHYHPQSQHHISSSFQPNSEEMFKLSHQKHGIDVENDDSDKLISVDEFDDSDNEDVRSCSTLSPTPSDNAVNSSSSHPYGSNHHDGGKSRKKGGMASKVMDEQELQSLRLKINSRERKRMHDLNSALDGLREVMPYAHGPSVRKLSKIATLLLAKNYILMLNSSLEEMKKLVSDVYHNHGAPRPSPHTSAVPPPPHPPPQTPNPNVVAPTAGAAASSVTNGSITSLVNTSSASHISGRCITPISKPSESSTPHPSTVIPLTPLATHPTTNPMLPLPIPALRAPVPGLTSHDISALTTAYGLPKADINTISGLQALAAHDRSHPFQRWPAPCACAQCLSGSGHLPLGLHLSRFSHPLLTPGVSLARKH